MLRTIETDSISPFGEPEVPAAEWTYRLWLSDAVTSGRLFARAYLGEASRRAQRTFDTVPDFPQGQSLGRSVYAFVDDGRWLWACPVCNAAQVCSESDRRAFCIECFNAGDGWWPVVWPDAETIAAADHVLAARPSDAQRNWHPQIETLLDLQHENLAHGIDPDAPGHVILGNVVVLAKVKEQLDALGFPMLEGPEDELLALPPDEMQKALQARVAQREIERAEIDR